MFPKKNCDADPRHRGGHRILETERHNFTPEPKMYDVTEYVNLTSVNLVTPVRILGMRPSVEATFNVIIGHGLGATDPSVKNHLTDSWVDVISDGVFKSGGNASCLPYTARGHGDSHGWEDSASTNIYQFTWQSLSADMIAIADYYQLPSFVASGSSMGSGSTTRSSRS